MSSHVKILFTVLMLSALLVSGSVLLWPSTAHAEYATYPDGWEIIPAQCLGSQGKGDQPCDLEAFVQLFVNLAAIGLKVLPLLAMLMLIWAGFNLIMAGGSPEKIQQGKKMIVSVVVGVIIVIFLAWGYSSFVIFALTGSTKIFDTDWWGGGEGGTPSVAGTGCCIIEGQGCQEVVAADCTKLASDYGVSPQFMGANQWCEQYKTKCANYGYGCCVPKNSGDTTCYYPSSSDYKNMGCVDLPNTKHSDNNCDTLAQCENITGTAAGLGATGCCETNNSCKSTLAAQCNGEFHAGESCGDISTCLVGCCIGTAGCTRSKIDCNGTYSPTACDQQPAGNCSVGCCITSDNCVASTQSSCTGTYNASACSAVPECTDGCCIDKCVEGKIDGACSGLQYDASHDCSEVGASCGLGCCLKANATRCEGGLIAAKDCKDSGDTFWAGTACNAVAGLPCNEGCCMDDTSGTWSCTGNYALLACTNAGGHFSATNDCATAFTECRTGCCGNVSGVCADSYNDMRCYDTTGSNLLGTNACSTYGQCQGCCRKTSGDFACSITSQWQCTALAPSIFSSGQTSCSGINECEVGCCATPYVGINYSCRRDSTRGYCASQSGGVFHPDDADCNSWASYSCISAAP